jgi:ADP-ribosylglycohydrolase
LNDQIQLFMTNFFPEQRPRGAKKASLESRIYGGWLGKSIGGTLGLPSEGKTHRLNYTFYDPIPLSAPPNDDLELQLVWLDLVESLAGGELTRQDFANAWLRHIHYMWDEYGRCRWNLRRGVPVDAVGTFENFFESGMGSPIRSEIWACIFPGDPASAAYYAALDASLDHGVEGIAGEVFFAVMQSLVIDGIPLSESIAAALKQIPASSETSHALNRMIRQHDAKMDVWACWKDLLATHGSDNFTHAPLNVALTVWALLYGEGDFGQTILLATNGGYDTDCTAATAGATLGLANPEGIPSKWSEPIGDGIFIGPGIRDIRAPATLQELTQRTGGLISKLGKKTTADWDWTATPPPVNLSTLPGTLEILPHGESRPVYWANGELSDAVKSAKGATWNWEVTHSESRKIICLAPGGAKLFIDGTCVIECPPDLPFVPATHRPPEGSRIDLTPGPGSHTVRLELNSPAKGAPASVVLAYPNYHICPWTASELPNQAILAI